MRSQTVFSSFSDNYIEELQLSIPTVKLCSYYKVRKKNKQTDKEIKWSSFEHKAIKNRIQLINSDLSSNHLLRVS